MEVQIAGGGGELQGIVPLAVIDQPPHSFMEHVDTQAMRSKHSDVLSELLNILAGGHWRRTPQIVAIGGTVVVDSVPHALLFGTESFVVLLAAGHIGQCELGESTLRIVHTKLQHRRQSAVDHGAAKRVQRRIAQHRVCGIFPTESVHPLPSVMLQVACEHALVERVETLAAAALQHFGMSVDEVRQLLIAVRVFNIGGQQPLLQTIDFRLGTLAFVGTVYESLQTIDLR